MGQLPGISDKVVDKTQTISSPEGLVSAMPLELVKGPTEPTYFTGTDDFLLRATPNGKLEYGMSTGYWEAYNYLSQTQPLLITPVNHKNSTYGGLILSSVLEDIQAVDSIADPDAYEFEKDTDLGLLVGATPGDWHSDISIKITLGEKDIPEGAFKLIIKKSTGEEEIICSFDQNGKDGYGVTTFIETVLANHNDIKFIPNPEADITQPIPAVSEEIALGESSLGDPVTTAEVVEAIQKLSNAKKYAFTYITDSIYNTPEVTTAISACIKARNEKGFATFTAPINALMGSDPVTTCKNYLDSLAINDFNCEITPQWLKYTDTFNSRSIYIPGGLAICANSAIQSTTYGFHESSAGVDRGVLSGYSDVYHNFNDEESNLLCQAGFNPIIKDPDDGIYVADDQTLQSFESALSNKTVVTNLNMKIRPAIASLCKPYVKKNNTSSVRNELQTKARLYMQSCYDNEEIYDFLVKCDNTNNTKAVINSRNLILDVGLSPVLPINWITIRFTLTPYGDVISELI